MGKRSIATIGREKLLNINMNKTFLLQVYSSKVTGMHKLYENTRTKVYKCVATADVQIRNFRKIRCSRVKIKVIGQIAIHPAIRASYNVFYSADTIHWIGDLSNGYDLSTGQLINLSYNRPEGYTMHVKPFHTIFIVLQTSKNRFRLYFLKDLRAFGICNHTGRSAINDLRDRS